MKKKILAYNLPAFHRIPENDEWWGEGFTEWDNVRRAKPLHKNHIQPMIPLREKYYDLSNKDDVILQTKLAEKYGIYGFIYYHYWFLGKLLLEKPVEIYKNSSEGSLKYCFCWANESWCRTWNGNNKDVLIAQNYGDKEDWEKHFLYLLDFFNDSRYIKENNSPMLFVYSISRIPNFDEMFRYWNMRAIESGFDGIYLVETISPWSPNVSSMYSSAVTEFEPMYSMKYEIGLVTKAYRFIHTRLGIGEFLNYDEIWRKILKRNRKYKGRKIFQGFYVNWDNSPRKGKKGIVFVGSSPEKFEEYVKTLLSLNREDGTDYYVVNAWNEWGEGAMLEPSVYWGYKYLEALKNAIEIYENE